MKKEISTLIKTYKKRAERFKKEGNKALAVAFNHAAAELQEIVNNTAIGE